MSTQKSHVQGLGFSSNHLFSPLELVDRFPRSADAVKTVEGARETIKNILHGDEDKLMIITGPCSIHDEEAALDYARRLIELRNRLSEKIYIVMRVYFEKPRTTVGWKGLINDPELNETFDISQGLQRARRLLQEINDMGMPAASEFLDPVVPHYFEDLVSWVAIGARTTESQTHRQMASAIGIPVGFKNGTDGSFETAAEGILAARNQHSYVGTGPDGHVCVLRTEGNPDGHLVLRGGKAGPNYDADSIKAARAVLSDGNLDQRLVVDCSHGNSNKDHERQPLVFEDVISQRAAGDKSIVGVMLESNINPGSQKLGNDSSTLEYGISITDACVGWDKTEEIILWADDTLG
ncbi:3-deoxy-7-phosphoheptulonate synthase [Chloroflexi bacterium]|nr:3-deoxy-7-phosphoheptulonate synthase [Chloroflexota bacterium]